MTTTTARATGKLGKLPVRTDVRTLRLRRYVDPSKLPPPPAELDLTERVNEWPMYANDRIGDCTTAAAGHMIEAWTAAAVGQAIEISESSVLTAFDAVKIVDPRSGEESDSSTCSGRTPSTASGWPWAPSSLGMGTRMAPGFPGGGAGGRVPPEIGAAADLPGRSKPA